LSTEFRLTYSGETADEGVLEFYDASVSLVGFHRSLALTTHLVLNNEIITQAPALKGAQLLVKAPAKGSWEITTVLILIASGVYKLGTLKSDTPIGHLISSAYDYVISETLGFRVDYNKTLGQQVEELKEAGGKAPPGLAPVRLDSLIEKCQTAIKDMHRPIVFSRSAKSGAIVSKISSEQRVIGTTLNAETFDYVSFETLSDSSEQFMGHVTSYNINTFKGRIYVPSIGRPIPFTVLERARHERSIALICESLTRLIHRFDAGQAG